MLQLIILLASQCLGNEVLMIFPVVAGCGSVFTQKAILSGIV